MLTGQAKEDFLIKIYYQEDTDQVDESDLCSLKNESEKWFNRQDLRYQLALIVEWFDSVGIYIDIDFFRKNIKEEPLFAAFTTDKYNGLQELGIEISSRPEASTAAITKANEIYNIHIANSEQKNSAEQRRNKN